MSYVGREKRHPGERETQTDREKERETDRQTVVEIMSIRL